jgi:trehalose-6-phosphatase
VIGAGQKWRALEEQVRSVLKEYPDLRLTKGRKVLEVRPSIKWDKGNAIQFLLECLGECAFGSRFWSHGMELLTTAAADVLIVACHGFLKVLLTVTMSSRYILETIAPTRTRSR